MFHWRGRHSSDEWTADLVREWVAIDTTYREKRRFLEAHLALLDPRSLDVLARAAREYADDAAMSALLTLHTRVLRDTLARGGDRPAAVRAVYVNWFGGFVLDLPTWLEALEPAFEAPRGPSGGPSGAASPPTRVVALREAIQRGAAPASPLPPEVLAELRLRLWDALTDETDQAEDARLEECIAALEAALAVYTAAAYPIRHVVTVSSLASAYINRVVGVPMENIEQGIALYEQALELAAREDIPAQSARLNHGLANAYLKRQRGEPGQNIERGIAYCERALEVLTQAETPEPWALAMNTLGNLYQRRTAGGLRENDERAIDCYQQALLVFTLDAAPANYAMVQNNLGTAFRERIAGDPIANAEFSMAAHFEALKVYTRDAYPLDYAMTICNLASTSLARPAISARQNIESAIRGYQEALQIFTFERYPERYAMVQNNLGLAYADRPGGRADDIEQAITAYLEALRVYRKERFPADYALTMGNLGTAYWKRQRGTRSANLTRAITCYHEALSIYTPDAFPVEHRLRQLSLVYPEAELGDWEAVHTAYRAAGTIEERLLRVEAIEEARAALLRAGRDTAPRDGFALVRLGRMEEAIATLERGRARGLAEAFAHDSAESGLIADERLRARFDAARRQFLAARAWLYGRERPPLDQEAFLREWERRAADPVPRQEEAEAIARYQAARAEFDGVVAELVASGYPAGLLQPDLSAADILRIAESLGPGHAILYLVATSWGGVAVGAFASPAGGQGRFAALELPDLTFERVAELVQARLTEETLHVIGGFNHAQRGNGLASLLLPIWPGTTFRARAMALYAACVAAGKPSSISAAAQRALRVPALAGVVDRPLAELTEEEHRLLEGTMNHLFLRTEVRLCLDKLGGLVMRPLGEWLRVRGAKTVTLIPCGFLETFPLTAVQLADGQSFAETFPASIAPSARALQRGAEDGRARQGIRALGDPRPTHQELPWGEAEALTIAKLARMYGLPGVARVQERAAREWFIEALGSARAVFASCHGMFHALDFLRSPLMLAHQQTLTLADALSQQVNLRGMRLLVLSACQTALPDVRSQTDEVRSLAAGMIQAGARAVLATLWPVDDEATYLLVVRFAQEWLPVMEHQPPALALARAQHWLRTVTNRRLHAWRIATLPSWTGHELSEAGARATWSLPAPLADDLADGAGDGAAQRMTLAVRGRGTRYTISEAEQHMRSRAASAPPDACPFADPIYWAGFQIIGW